MLGRDLRANLPGGNSYVRLGMLVQYVCRELWHFVVQRLSDSDKFDVDMQWNNVRLHMRDRLYCNGRRMRHRTTASGLANDRAGRDVADADLPLDIGWGDDRR